MKETLVVNVYTLPSDVNCHHFQDSTQNTMGEGDNGNRTLFLNVDYDALHFYTGTLKINIIKVLFWEGGRGS